MATSMLFWNSYEKVWAWTSPWCTLRGIYRVKTVGGWTPTNKVLRVSFKAFTAKVNIIHCIQIDHVLYYTLCNMQDYRPCCASVSRVPKNVENQYYSHLCEKTHFCGINRRWRRGIMYSCKSFIYVFLHVHFRRSSEHRETVKVYFLTAFCCCCCCCCCYQPVQVQITFV